MTSGSANTSCGNSLTTGCTIDYTFRQLLGYKDYKMLVHGDDNLLVIKGHIPEDVLKEKVKTLKEFMNKLGFKIKCKTSYHWYDVEYCSSLFWPTRNGYVLGPKIGKRLPKIGFSLRKLEVGDVKGMIIGLKCEANFIPVIRLYINKMFDLLKKVKSKDYVDKRSVYKSLASEIHSTCDDTNMFFFERYGTTVEEAELMFRECTKGAGITSCVDYPLLKTFTDRDL